MVEGDVRKNFNATNETDMNPQGMCITAFVFLILGGICLGIGFANGFSDSFCIYRLGITQLWIIGLVWIAIMLLMLFLAGIRYYHYTLWLRTNGGQTTVVTTTYDFFYFIFLSVLSPQVIAVPVVVNSPYPGKNLQFSRDHFISSTTISTTAISSTTLSTTGNRNADISSSTSKF
jgi:hypothetical protein